MALSLAFIQEPPLEDIAAWSQIPANMRQNFRPLLGDGFREAGGFHYPFIPLLRLRAAIFRFLLRRPFLSDRSAGRWRFLAKAARKEVPPSTNWVLSVSTSFLSFWSKAPGERIAFWTDSTFRQFVNYWPSHKSLSSAFVAMGDELERRAIVNADLCIYSSQWAANSAIKDYSADPAKVLIAPFGPNLPAPMLQTANQVWSAPKTELRLLSVGVDWSRKGMDIAVEVVSGLRNRGLEVFLDIAGVSPPDGLDLPAFVCLHGRLDKNHPEQQATLTRLFSAASAFILLSRADASPVVFSEAAAFGLPRFAFDTGGMASLITDEIDGCLFDPKSGAPEIANRIAPILADPTRLAKMRHHARQGYETRWNWPTQCKAVLARMNALVTGPEL